MKTLTLQLGFDEAVIHPMHAFVADHEAYGPTRMLQWNPLVGETNVILFHVDGPREPFLSVLTDVSTAEAVETSAAAEGGFYLYVRERLEGSAQELVSAYAEEECVVVPPLVYDVDRTLRFSVVGDGEALQRTLARTPSGIDVSVLRIRSGAGDAVRSTRALSERQREVVAGAIEAGYYEEPREATVAEVADRFDCAPSTVAEHLRKAESALVSRAFEDGVDRGSTAEA